MGSLSVKKVQRPSGFRCHTVVYGPPTELAVIRRKART